MDEDNNDIKHDEEDDYEEETNPSENEDENDETKKKAEEKEDNPKNVMLIIGIVIAVLIILFASGYIYTKYFYNPDAGLKKVTYNQFDFVYYEDLWHFQWQRGNDVFNVHLRYNPTEVENVEVRQIRPFNNFTTDKVYITFDPEGNLTQYTTLGVTELSLSLKKVFGKDPIGSCMRNVTSACADREIITCENTNQSVVMFKEAPETLVTIDGNCLIVQGQKIELLKAVDRVLYEWYGIIKPKY